MRLVLLHELPDLVLHKICLKLPAKDITSLQETNRKLFKYIRTNRLYYNKHRVKEIMIYLTIDWCREVKVLWGKNRRRPVILKGSVEKVMKSFIPQLLKTYDHDELANMHPLWWKNIAQIDICYVVDYRRYLPHFDRCTDISLESDNLMNLSEILTSMETKNLNMLCLTGNGELECSDDDLRKIGRLSNDMQGILLGNISESSNISNDAVLDMIEIGSFARIVTISVSKIHNNMVECIRRRNWVVEHKVIGNTTRIVRADKVVVRIQVVKKHCSSSDMLRIGQRRYYNP